MQLLPGIPSRGGLQELVFFAAIEALAVEDLDVAGWGSLFRGIRLSALCSGSSGARLTPVTVEAGFEVVGVLSLAAQHGTVGVVNMVCSGEFGGQLVTDCCTWWC